MGSAMLAGWQDHQVDVIDPQPNEIVKQSAKNIFTSLTEVQDNYDGIILAVKPQIFPEVLPLLKDKIANAWVLSIAAGKTLQSIAVILGNEIPLIRAMPNIPALIGQGMTVCVANSHVTQEQKQNVSSLLNAIGDLVWIDDEEQMHAVTALSGSGPGYVFAFIEAMEKAGIANGLSPVLSRKLAIKTVQGAGAMVLQSDKTPAELREQVTSVKGTTAAALEILQGDDALDVLVNAAIAAAAKRSKELA